MHPTRGLDPASDIHHLFVRIPRADAWNKRLRVGDNAVFCPTHRSIAVGAKVVLEVAVATGPRFFLGATVTSRRIARDVRMLPGVTVRVSRASLDVLGFVDAWSVGSRHERRTHWRLPVRLAVTYRAGKRRRVNFTKDLSQDGVFIHATEILSPGERIEFRLLLPDVSHAFSLAGEVAHDGGGQGMGIRLQFDDETQRARYLELLPDIQRACTPDLWHKPAGR